MKKLTILVLTSCLPVAVQAAQDAGSFYSNIGATVVTNDSHDESAYTLEFGYNHKIYELISAGINYKRVETLNSSVSAGSNGFVQKYDAYGLALRADQYLGGLNVYGEAGINYINSETTTWDTTAGGKKVDEDETVKPYATAGVNVASLDQQGVTLGVSISYQMLANGEYATSINTGANLAF